MWQFTINDYTSGSLVTTAIQEPVGWDAVNLHLKRDPKAHGFFSFEDNSFSDLQFDGNGAEILRNAYYNYGVMADVMLGVSYNCDGTTTDSIYLGSFDFTSFKDYVGDRCYVECPTYVSEAYFLLKNRSGQQVDLDGLASYDQLPESQTVNTNAIFQAATTMLGQSFGQIRVTQLLNGILPGSKIVITGSVHNNATFTVASAKPDYSNVNPDLAGGGSSAIDPTVSATFDASNMTISVNQLLNIAVGTTISISTATWPSGNITYTVYDNTGTYNVLSVQQFFNYTVLTIALNTLIPVTPSNTLNYQGTPYMVSTSQETVVITGTIIYTSQPTATIITVAEAIVSEPGITITLSGSWLKNNMQPYAALGKIITMPAKVIEATSIYKQVEDGIYELGMGNAHAHGTLSSITAFITPSMANIQSDINETDVGTGEAYIPISSGLPDYNGGFNSAHVPDSLIFFRQNSIPCAGLASLKYSITYQYLPYDSGDGQNYDVGVGPLFGATRSARFIIFKGSDPTNLTGPAVISIPIDNDSWPMSKTTISGEVDNISLNPGEYIWMWFLIPVTNNTDAYYPKLLIGAGSTLQVTINSQCVDTPCSVYMINEALSRCAESYTNGELQVYSDYFGRINAQPQPSSADGCGALAAITNGLRIRGCIMPDSSAIPKFFTSLDDMLTALDAIHNIGWAIEPDPTRSGKLRLRVEPYEHWFQNTVMLTCKNVMSITRETVPSLLPSTFKCGYQQFEMWSNNGLYDIFGSRQYRTPLNHLVNEFDKTCKWMASDYAIEFTRRQFGVTTSDSRYDDSTFILCLTNKYVNQAVFTKSCVLVYDPTNVFATVGDSITITGAANSGNNVTSLTIANINILSSDTDPSLKLIFVTGATFANEQAGAAKLHNNTSNTDLGPQLAYFISSNGAAILTQEDLFNAKSGDSITLSGSTYSDGTYVISSLFVAQPTGILTNVNFPMVVYPASAIPSGSFSYRWDIYVHITNANNQFYAVEQGMKNGTNILAPDTVMNYRISPAHNAMRHYRNVITDRQYLTESLIFTGGEGNFYALGKINDSCTPENDNISEGGNLSLANFTVADDGKPLFYPELVKFEYPLTWDEFLAIMANPYGEIQYEHLNEGLQSGYLVDLQYHPFTGVADFELYPKI